MTQPTTQPTTRTTTKPRCQSCRYGEKCDTCHRVRICDQHGYVFGVMYDAYSGGHEADGMECERCHRRREAQQKVDEAANRIQDALGEGPHWVLEWDGKRVAFLQDEESDDAPERVPVASVRRLVDLYCVAPWREVTWYGRRFVTYRPHWWVEAWFEAHPNETRPKPATEPATEPAA